MKVLMIGIDGGTKRILDYMPMPFTHALFRNAKARILSEDLISRGWAEVLSGQHASATAAFYLAPFCDGSYRFTRSYGMNDLLAAPSVKPLWTMLNELGVKVGILNVPTTGPAPEVDGFLVAGGGGGLKPGDAIAPEMAWPREASKMLDAHQYIFDVRLPAGKITFSDFADKIEIAQEAQKEAFLALCRTHKPDFGFHCFRITTELQYLAISEIEAYINEVHSAKADRREPRPANDVQRKLVQHYVHMDSCIRQLFEQCSPESFIFIGDHSTKPLLREINLDIWLEQAGYLKRLGAIDRRVMRLRDLADRVSNRIFARLGFTKKRRLYRVPQTKFSKSRTLAFGTFFETGNFGGMYINDRARFGGPTNDDGVLDRLVDEICVKFNGSAEASKYELKAIPFKRKYKGTAFEKYLPDIEIQKPDESYFSCRRAKFCVPNVNYGPVPEDLTGVKYPLTGVKGRDPIFVYSRDLEAMIEENDPYDLTLAYKLVQRIFKKR